MVVSEQVAERPPPLDVRGRPAGPGGGTARSVAAGVLMVLAGLVVLWVSQVPMRAASGVLVLGVVCVSAALLYLGVKRLGMAWWGPQWDAGVWLSGAWLVLLVLAAVFADVLPLGEYRSTVDSIGVPGNVPPNLFSAHPLGTNNFSLDLLARCIYGARVSLLTVATTVVLSLVVGGTIGMIAGYFRGKFDATLGMFTDAALAVPPLVLLIALAGVLGVPQTPTEAVLKNGAALAVVGIPTMIRLSRANSMLFAQREFVLASRTIGARSGRILLRELMPNVVLPLLSYAFILMAVLIVAEGSLAYLGLGLQQPQPTWGNMIAEAGITQLRAYPHIALVPGAFIFLTVYSLNRLGERARKAWDPREAKL